MDQRNSIEKRLEKLRKKASKANTTNAMMTEIIGAMLFSSQYPHATARITLCIFGQINGVKFPLQAALIHTQLPTISASMHASKNYQPTNRIVTHTS